MIEKTINPLYDIPQRKSWTAEYKIAPLKEIANWGVSTFTILFRLIPLPRRDFSGGNDLSRYLLGFSRKEEKGADAVDQSQFEQLSRPIVEFPAFGCDCEYAGAVWHGGANRGWNPGGGGPKARNERVKRATLCDLPGVSRIRFHGPEVGVVFALSIGFPSVVWGQWHGEMPTVAGAVWFSRG